MDTAHTTFGALGLALGLAGILAVGCTRLNASHCGNQSGDLTCEQRGGSTPFCDKCEAANDGCVAEPVTELGCGFGMGSGSGGASSDDSGVGGSGSGSGGSGLQTTDAVDSSGDGGPACGNGMIDEGEECDGDTLPEDATCASQGHGDGLPVCALDCASIVYAVCPGYSDCGDGAIAPGEECDLDNLGNETCDHYPNLTGDGLACTEQCTFNTSACMSCQENQQSCDAGESCCDPQAECKSTLFMGKRCCIPGALGACS
ncbi:hypothetical protein [Paraliomyxa miuraensis]|uniref:hypothetical protein n=1 Tax=Paraliomyxa miuraensis TaxID=376150 RepID=UPI00225671BF|nr:hypothetical protein [Paraliomyxa miuraensis]MCX4246951.1 hypothetical protein [Paraliomyxa miuraensis]